MPRLRKSLQPKTEPLKLGDFGERELIVMLRALRKEPETEDTRLLIFRFEQEFRKVLEQFRKRP